MDGLLDGIEHLERELSPEPIAAPATGSIVLHALLAGGLVYSAWLAGLFHHNLWGNPGAGGAIQVNLVTSTLPLPAEQVNQNVLATETPSQAPAPPSPKEQKQVDETAIPILGKNAKPQPKNTPKTQKSQPQPQQNVAQFGEQSGSIMPHSVQPQMGSNGPTAVGDNDFASRFGWYVDQINRTMSTNWNRFQVDPRTPKGARVYMVFSILKDGSHGEGQLDRSSGSPTLDRSCMQALQRIDAFQKLPSGYNQGKLQVSYYCEY
jgi:periplasmic protein TonB